MNFKNVLLLNFVILFGVFSFSKNGFSQNYYESSFENLKDSIYYPKIDNFINKGQVDSVLYLANEVYDFYNKKDEKDRALYLFNLCIYFPSGYGLAEKAIPVMENKLVFLRENTDTLNVHFGTSNYILAEANIRLFELNNAVPIFNNAISILEKVKKTPALHLAQAYKSAAFLNVYLYNNQRAYKLAKLAINKFKSVDTNGFSQGKQTQVIYDIAYSYLTFAVLMKQIGQIELSFAYNVKALEVFTTLPTGKENMVVSANNAADNCLVMKKYNLALQYIHFADSIVIANNFQKKLKTTYISVLSNKGKTYMNLGQYADADIQFRLLKQFMDKEFKPMEPTKANAYINIGNNFHLQNNLDSALFYYTQASKFNYNKTEIYTSLAEIYDKRNDFKKALEYSQQNILLYLKKTPSSLNKTPYANNFTDNYNGYKATYLSAKYYYSFYEQSLNPELLEKSIQFSNLSDSLISRHRDVTLIGGDDVVLAKEYHDIANIGINASYDAHKAENNEKYLNCFLKFITQTTAFKLNAEVNQVVGETGSSTEQIQLLQKIRKAENELLALENNPNPKLEKEISQKLFNFKVKAFELSFNLQSNDDNIVSSDLFEEIKYTEIQKNLLENEALVAFFMSKTELFSILITQNNVKINKVETGDDFNKLLNNYYKSLKTSSPKLKTYANQMYSYLISPFSEEIKNIKKLVVIPDGKLAQVPFETLMYSENSKSKYLIEKLAISYNYSVFLWLRSRKLPKDNEMLSFVGFAPVFSESNCELNENSPLRYNDELRGNYSEISNGDNLNPLPFSEKEVIDIQKLFVKAKQKAKIFTKENATEKNLKQNINGYSIVHIATHGYSSKIDPELSGLFLYKNSDKSFKSVTDDGFIYLGEVFTLKLDAELVVLSACKTGTGKITEGEAVIALPRAFIFAGTPNLVASLWKIHDEKTKNLMVDFYKSILKGNSYSEALRQAKLLQIKNGELPIDWSGIILIGE